MDSPDSSTNRPQANPHTGAGAGLGVSGAKKMTEENRPSAPIASRPVGLVPTGSNSTSNGHFQPPQRVRSTPADSNLNEPTTFKPQQQQQQQGNLKHQQAGGFKGNYQNSSTSSSPSSSSSSNANSSNRSVPQQAPGFPQQPQRSHPNPPPGGLPVNSPSPTPSATSAGANNSSGTNVAASSSQRPTNASGPNANSTPNRIGGSGPLTRSDSASSAGGNPGTPNARPPVQPQTSSAGVNPVGGATGSSGVRPPPNMPLNPSQVPPSVGMLGGMSVPVNPSQPGGGPASRTSPFMNSNMSPSMGGMVPPPGVGAAVGVPPPMTLPGGLLTTPPNMPPGGGMLPSPANLHIQGGQLIHSPTGQPIPNPQQVQQFLQGGLTPDQLRQAFPQPNQPVPPMSLQQQLFMFQQQQQQQQAANQAWLQNPLLAAYQHQFFQQRMGQQPGLGRPAGPVVNGQPMPSLQQMLFNQQAQAHVAAQAAAAAPNVGRGVGSPGVGVGVAPNRPPVGMGVGGPFGGFNPNLPVNVNVGATFPQGPTGNVFPLPPGNTNVGRSPAAGGPLPGQGMVPGGKAFPPAGGNAFHHPASNWSPNPATINTALTSPNPATGSGTPSETSSAPPVAPERKPLAIFDPETGQVMDFTGLKKPEKEKNAPPPTSASSTNVTATTSGSPGVSASPSTTPSVSDLRPSELNLQETPSATSSERRPLAIISPTAYEKEKQEAAAAAAAAASTSSSSSTVTRALLVRANS